MKRHWLLTAVMTVLLCYALFIPLAMLMAYFFAPPLSRHDPQTFKGQVKVASSKMLFGRSDKDGPVVCVIGILKNDSDVGWKEAQLEAQFYDRTGQLIDVGTDQWQRVIFQVPPHGECAFKIRLPADHPTDSYASYKLFVRSAVDARSWP